MANTQDHCNKFTSTQSPLTKPELCIWRMESMGICLSRRMYRNLMYNCPASGRDYTIDWRSCSVGLSSFHFYDQQQMAQLPPKIPPHMTQNWPLFPNNHHHNQTLLPPPSPHIAAAPSPVAAASRNHLSSQPSWVDEFLDFSSTRRGHHRRSVSDGVTFIETGPLVEDHNQHGFDRLDDDQLLSMFTDGDMSLDLPPHPASNTAMSSPLSTPSDQHSNNEDQIRPSQLSENLLELQAIQQQQQHPLGEVDSSNKLSPDSLGPSSANSDTIVDPKRVKRILANRQSAQRSRVRKLQYISELERSVTSLQSEVSALSPRVAFLDHQRLILNANNSEIKQRIAALVQDKIFKDAHQEALKQEIERLRQIYHQQTLKNSNQSGQDNNDNSNKMGNNNAIVQPTSQQQVHHLQLSTLDMAMACTDK